MRHDQARARTRTRLCRSLLAFAGTAAVVGAGAFNAPARASVFQPVLSISASASVPVGEAVSASAGLSNGMVPTGSVAFRLYGPSDPTCAGAPVFTSQVTTLGNGTYASAAYVANTAGTYRWTATYTGDLVHFPAATSCSAASASVFVSKRFPTLRGQASTGTGGSTTFTNVTITGGGPAGPTGTLTFNLYGPYNGTCTGSPIFTSTATIAGPGPHASGVFAPTLPGTYQWVAIYSGDANNYSASTSCVEPSQNVGVVAGPAVSLTVTPPTAHAGQDVTVAWSGMAVAYGADWVALYAAGAPNSAIRAWRYTTGATSGSVNLTVPWDTPAGAYEVRLFGNNSTVRLATAALTVS